MLTLHDKLIICVSFCTSQYVPTPEWRDYCQEQASLPELPYTQCPCPPRSLPWQGPTMENGTVLHIHTQASASLTDFKAHFYCAYVFAHVCSRLCAGYQLRASIYSYGPTDSQSSPFAHDASIRSAEALSGKPTRLTLLFSLYTIKSHGGAHC